MKVTTLRLPEPLYEDLTEEAEELDRSFSEYVRMLLRTRQGNTDGDANTPTNTADYAERIRALEARVAALEESYPTDPGADASRGVTAADSPAPPTPPSGDAVDAGRGEESDASPQGSPAEMAVAHVREHGPVSRADLLELVADEIEIKPDSWWRRHGRPALEEAGAEFRRNVGWRFVDS